MGSTRLAPKPKGGGHFTTVGDPLPPVSGYQNRLKAGLPTGCHLMRPICTDECFLNR